MGNTQQLYGRLDMVMLDRQDKIYGSLGMHDNYLLSTVTGNPLTLTHSREGKIEEEVTDCKIYGWSKQKTTKGKNLFDFSRLVSDGVNVMNYEKQTITVPAKTNNTGYNQTLRDLCPGITPGTYVFSAKRSNPESGNGSYFLEAGLDFTFNTPTELTDALLDNHIAWYNNPDSEVENVISEIQIEIGTEATDYEPYTGGQPSPSPDYPQQIVSAGNSGNIEVNVRGKNLVDIYGYSANSMDNPEAERVLFNTYGTTLSTTEKTDKLIVHQEIIDGATANSYTSGYFCIGINRKLETGKDYIITFNINVIQNPFSVSTIFVLFNGIEANRAEVIGDKVTVKVSCKEDGERQYVEVRNCGMSLEISNFMITEKDENTIYEPYYEPQTISISTPTGLPAIPVDSDGNYTDANGQQWIADYVDLKRGKYVQMVDIEEVTDVGAIPDTYFHTAVYTPKHEVGVSAGGISSYGFEVRASNAYGTNFGIFELNKYFDTLEDWKEWIDTQNTKGNAIDCYLPLKEPIERDLTTEEIEAYKNLVTYAGTTIVENDAECYMECTYKASGNE